VERKEQLENNRIRKQKSKKTVTKSRMEEKVNMNV